MLGLILSVWIFMHPRANVIELHGMYKDTGEKSRRWRSGWAKEKESWWWGFPKNKTSILGLVGAASTLRATTLVFILLQMIIGYIKVEHFYNTSPSRWSKIYTYIFSSSLFGAMQFRRIRERTLRKDASVGGFAFHQMRVFCISLFMKIPRVQ